MTQVLGTALPENWTASRLKRVTSLLNRGSAPDYVDDGPVRAISQAANQPGGLDWARTRFHDATGDPRRLKGYLLPDDILINSTGTGTLGRIGYFQGGPDEIPCMADTHVTVARAIPPEVDSRFLYYWLSSIPFQEYIYAALVVGATNQIELNRDRLGDAPVPLPPAEEQRRISGFLDAEVALIDDVVSARVTQLAILDRRLSAIRDALVEEYAERFPLVPLRRFTARIEQGASPQCDNSPAGADEWAVLKLSSVKRGMFAAGENKRLPELGNVVRQNEVKLGDFLVTRANTPDLVGDVAVVRETPSRRLLPDLIYRVLLDPALDADYVAEVALSGRIRALVKADARGSSQSMVKLRGEDIKNWPIPVACMAAQKQLVATMGDAARATGQLKSAIRRQIDLLTERRRALITAAVTGQIDVTTARGVRVP